jgi:hypothetical protein
MVLIMKLHSRVNMSPSGPEQQKTHILMVNSLIEIEF